MKTKLMTMCLVMAVLAIGSTAQAALITTISEVGDDVVVTGSGSINTTDLSLSQSIWSAYIEADWGVTTGGTSPFSVSVDVWAGISGPSAIGSPAGSLGSADTSSGDRFGVFFRSGYDSLIVEEGYVSGTALSGTATWEDKSFAYFGLSEGTYEWTWGSGANADTATITVVPEPATMALLGLGGLGLLRRKRKA